MARPVITLALFGLMAALLLAAVDRATRERIELNQQRRALEILHQVLPPEAYDNELVSDRFEAWIEGLVPPTLIYRARKNGEPVALLADLVTADGYSGNIRLIAGLHPDGEIIAVRTVEHRETPGLGDRIELERSDWIRQFAGASRGNPPLAEWKPDRRGGQFDTLASATISSAAVTGALAKLLDWHAGIDERAFTISSTTENRPERTNP
ncbi:MAG: RnfABCDGE type electron transport complex subunit G [Wenzhouxiangellaceae bacterium]|nr:RnfABCDGE type electron transport complex subunit G [Wenzhouxiangellaceae bacterium]